MGSNMETTLAITLPLWGVVAWGIISLFTDPVGKLGLLAMGPVKLHKTIIRALCTLSHAQGIGGVMVHSTCSESKAD